MKQNYLKILILMVFLTSFLLRVDAVNLLNLPEEDRLFKAGEIYFQKGMDKEAQEVFAELLKKYPHTKYREKVYIYKYLESYKPHYLYFKYKFDVYYKKSGLMGDRIEKNEMILTYPIAKELPEKLEVALGNFASKFPRSKELPYFYYLLAKYYFKAEWEEPINFEAKFKGYDIVKVVLKEKWDPFLKKWIKLEPREYAGADYSKVYLVYFIHDIYHDNLEKAKFYLKKIITSYPDFLEWEEAVLLLARILQIERDIKVE